MKVIANDKKRLLSNFFSLTGLQIVTYILPLITLPYLVNVLGVDMFGLVMFSQSFAMLFGIIIDYGFNLSATREISIYRNDLNKVNEIFSSVIFIKVILGIISLIFLFIIISYVDKFSEYKAVYFYSFLHVLFQSMFPVWFFQGMERMRFIVLINIISKISFTLLILFIIRNSDDYILFPILNAISASISAVLGFIFIFRSFNIRFLFPTWDNILFYFKNSSHFFLSRVAVLFYTSANTFILGLVTNVTMVGYYAAAEKLYQAMQGLYSPVVQVLYPYIANKKNVRLFKKIFYTVVFLNILGLVVLYFISEYVFSILFSQSITSHSVDVFNILLVANLFVVPSILLGYPFLGALGFSKTANMSVVYSAVFHIIGIVILFYLDYISIFSISSLVILTQLVDLLFRCYGVYSHRLWNTYYD